jgi:dTDP-4-amino-4,6-dideoxygalactose transaminase
VVRFADVDERSYNLDSTRLEDAITERTRAVIPAHLYGQAAELDPILAIACRHRLYVLEDCTQCLGATYKGRQTGSFGNIACFSFSPGSNLGAYGDGGAVVTNHDVLVENLRLLRNHEQEGQRGPMAPRYCSQLDCLVAVVLDVKLPHVDGWNAARRSRAALYDQLLQEAPNLVTPSVRSRSSHVYHFYVIRVTDGRREALRQHLEAKGVRTEVHCPVPLHLQPAYASLGYKAGDFPVSEQLANQGLSLPLYPELTDGQVQYVAGGIKEFMNRPLAPARPGPGGPAVLPA